MADNYNPQELRLKAARKAMGKTPYKADLKPNEEKTDLSPSKEAMAKTKEEGEKDMKSGTRSSKVSEEKRQQVAAKYTKK